MAPKNVAPFTITSATLAVGGSFDPWCSAEILLNCQPVDDDHHSITVRLEQPVIEFGSQRVKTATVAKSYFLTDAQSAEKGLNLTTLGMDALGFVLKLPNLDGVNELADVKSRINAASVLFDRERLVDERLQDIEVVAHLLDQRSTASAVKDNIAALVSAPWLSEPEAMRVPFLLRRRVVGTSLRNWVTKYHGVPGKFRGLCFAQWSSVSLDLIRAVSLLHKERIAHGFISPDSIIVEDSRQFQFVKFINAAEYPSTVYISAAMASELASATVLRRWYDAPEVLFTKMLGSAQQADIRYVLSQGSHYHSATDIYSLGVTMCYLATGEEDAIKPFEHLKRVRIPGQTGWEIVNEFQRRTRTHAMRSYLYPVVYKAAVERETTRLRMGGTLDKLKITEVAIRQTETILHCVRSRIDRRARTVRHLRSTVDLFSGNLSSPITRQTDDARRSDPECADRLLKKIAEFNETETVQGLTPFLSAVILQRTRNLYGEIVTAIARSGGSSDASPPYTIISGGRGSLVESFLSLLSSVSGRDEIIALTTPTIWTDDNFGPCSRISTMLQLLRLQGCKMKWIIAVRRNELNGRELRRMLGFRRLDDELLRGVNGTSADRGYFYIPLNDVEYEQMQMQKLSFIGVVSRQGKTDGDRHPVNNLDFMVAPDFATAGGLLVSLTYWDSPSRGGNLLKAFRSYEGRANSVLGLDKYF